VCVGTGFVLDWDNRLRPARLRERSLDDRGDHPRDRHPRSVGPSEEQLVDLGVEVGDHPLSVLPCHRATVPACHCAGQGSSAARIEPPVWGPVERDARVGRGAPGLGPRRARASGGEPPPPPLPPDFTPLFGGGGRAAASTPEADGQRSSPVSMRDWGHGATPGLHLLARVRVARAREGGKSARPLPRLRR